MKKTLWAKALVIVAVFFVAACSTNTPPTAPEGAILQKETIGDHANMSPSEMLDACISVGKDMSFPEKIDMIEKLPPNGEVSREIEFLKTAYSYTRLSILSDSRMAHGQMRDALGVSELPPNIESFISALYDRASKEGKDSLPGINDILPGIIKKGYFLP